MRNSVRYPAIELKLFFGLLICFLASSAYSFNSYCLDEIDQYEKTKLSNEEASRLQYLKTFNTENGRYAVGMDVVRAHLNSSTTSNFLKSDKSPVSACILKKLADAKQNNKVDAGYALEGYALKLLNGDGVKRDLPLAEKYLERSAVEGEYGSAAYRLAKIKLQGNPNPQDTGPAISWAFFALKYADTTPGGSEDPSQATALLQGVVDKMVAKKNIKGARSVYQQVLAMRLKGSPEDLIVQGHPQLKEGSTTDALSPGVAAALAVTNQIEAWDRCFERITGYRAEFSSGYMGDDISHKSGRNVMRAVVRRDCGPRPY